MTQQRDATQYKYIHAMYRAAYSFYRQSLILLDSRKVKKMFWYFHAIPSSGSAGEKISAVKLSSDRTREYWCNPRDESRRRRIAPLRCGVSEINFASARFTVVNYSLSSYV
jgi:hypothetical protein